MEKLYSIPPNWAKHPITRHPSGVQSRALFANGRPASKTRFIVLLLVLVFSALAARAQDTTRTAIGVENEKTGTKAWYVAGDKMSSTIEGFTTEMSYNRGQQARFKIKTASPFKIKIFRLGYYKETGGCLKDSIVVDTIRTQPTCVTGSDGLVDCGNWCVSARWNIPSNAVSGV